MTSQRSGGAGGVAGDRLDTRHAQRLRTRQAILRAATELIEAGGTPTVAEAADAACFSRATAYRYFPTQAALLREASLLPGIGDPDDLFGPDAPTDVLDRIALASDVMYEHISARAAEFRIFLREQLLRALEKDAADRADRPGFRVPIIADALRPLAGKLAPRASERLENALAVLIGTEAVLTCTDVLHLDPERGRADMRWACRALVRAAVAEADSKRDRAAARRAQASGAA